jgi:hypothetical protein
MMAGGLACGLVAGAAAALFLLPGAPQRLAALPGLPAPARAMAAALDVPGVAALAPTPPPFSVALDSVRRAAAGGALEVAGEIRNTTSASRAAPAVELTLLDAGGRALDVIRLPAGPGPIPAGRSAGFSTVALNPPPGTARIAARVASGPLDRL